MFIQQTLVRETPIALPTSILHQFQKHFLLPVFGTKLFETDLTTSVKMGELSKLPPVCMWTIGLQIIAGYIIGVQPVLVSISTLFCKIQSVIFGTI